MTVPSMYGTAELMEVQVRLADLPDGFWRDRFTRTYTFDKAEVWFELPDVDNRKLAPFVAPNVQGRVMRGQGYYARSLRPAYVKPKHIVDPTKAIPRMMGEPLMGAMSLQARFDAHVTNNLRLEREAIERRWDWMACRCIADAKITIAGDDYPTVTVDFLRDPSLTVQLTGSATWNNVSTANPLGDLGSINDAAFRLGNGPITDLVFGTTAWSNFIQNQQVRDLLTTLSRGTNSMFPTIPLIQNANYQSMGQIVTPGGAFNLYRYSNWYSDVASDGTLTTSQFINPAAVVGIGPIFDGVALFGAIMDYDAGFAAEAQIFPKMWTEKDPSVVYTMSQSAPLYAMTNPNNTFKLVTQ